MILGGLIVAAIFMALQANAQDVPAVNTQAPAVVQNISAVAPMLHYQGQLLDPFTGAPKPDGPYGITFSIYNAAVGGAPLWAEAKNVAATDGLFSTMLGDTVPLNLPVFNGQQLWLGIKVGTDPEATPRQLFAYAPYALFTDNADKLDGLDASAFARADQAGGRGPLAFGFVDTDGSRISGYGDWTSRYVDQGGDQKGYLIRIRDVNYNYREYATVVTAACNFARIPNTSSSNGELLIEFFKQDTGSRTDCRFHFVVYKP
jgi:hypothetical protein